MSANSACPVGSAPGRRHTVSGAAKPSGPFGRRCGHRNAGASDPTRGGGTGRLGATRAVPVQEDRRCGWL